jgi:hypothetical protein
MLLSANNKTGPQQEEDCGPGKARGIAFYFFISFSAAFITASKASWINRPRWTPLHLCSLASDCLTSSIASSNGIMPPSGYDPIAPAPLMAGIAWQGAGITERIKSARYH